MLEQEDKPSSESVSADTIALGHEPTAISLRGIVWFFVVFVVSTAGACVVVWWTMIGFEATEVRSDPQQSKLVDHRAGPPPPWLQPSPAQGNAPQLPAMEMAEFAKQEERALNSYAQTGAADGTVQIPIRRAMEILAERGMSTTKPSQKR